MNNREPGMYWVRLAGNWKPVEWAYHRSYDEFYWFDNTTALLKDSDWDKIDETPIRPPVARRAEEMLELLEEFVDMCEGPVDPGLMERLYERANDLTYEIKEESKG
jgi:hypothetical protein